jgi:hypothetical protein
MHNTNLAPIKPWNAIRHYNDFQPSEEYYLRSFDGMTAKDFVFATLPHLAEDKVLVFIVPKEFWKEHINVFERSMPITYLLPTDLVEVDKSIFSTDASESDIRGRLLEIGFVWDKWMQTFIEKRYGSTFR